MRDNSVFDLSKYRETPHLLREFVMVCLLLAYVLLQPKNVLTMQVRSYFFYRASCFNLSCIDYGLLKDKVCPLSGW